MGRRSRRALFREEVIFLHVTSYLSEDTLVFSSCIPILWRRRSGQYVESALELDFAGFCLDVAKNYQSSFICLNIHYSLVYPKEPGDREPITLAHFAS